MAMTNSKKAAAVFFCIAGTVYDGPVNAEDGVNPASAPAPAAATPEPAKANFFAGAEKPAAPATAKPASEDIPAGQTVKASPFGEIDLHVKDLDVATVLQLLSIQSKRNIVATKEVAGTVTADLYSVDFYSALDAILQPNGFGYREKGKFIYVYTTAQLAEIQKAEEKPIVKVLHLNYLNAKDASTFVTPLLSSAGAVSISGEVPPGFAPSLTDGGKKDYASPDTMVIRDLQANVEQILAVLKELDVRPRQVRIKATVLKATLSEANAWGVDISILAGTSRDTLMTPLAALDELASGATKTQGADGIIGTTPGNARQGQSTIKVGFLSGSVDVFIRALDKVTDTTVIANPELLVLNRQRADMLVGGRLGYVSTQQTETSTTQTVEFLDIGTQLTVRPFISNDDMIRMEVKPSISTGFTQLVGGFVIPQTESQDVTTNVLVGNGQTAVIGGLFQQDHQVERSQVPGLGDVPIVGAAFKGVDDKSGRSEIIFMITPTIMKDEVLYATGKRTMQDADLKLIGTRDKLLPWSREKMTSATMQNAIAHYQAGRKDQALMEATKALNQDSGIVDARKMKAELLGEQINVFKQSILSNVTDDVIKEHMKPADPAKPADAGKTAPAAEKTAAEAKPAAEQPAAEKAAPAAATAEQPAAQTPATPAADATNPSDTARVIDAVNRLFQERKNDPAQPQPANPDKSEADADNQPAPTDDAPAPTEKAKDDAQPAPTEDDTQPSPDNED